MPCSCGNTTCPCGIPCYCMEESCKCHACAIALHRFCKICSKPIITDVETDKDTCSCFVGESTAFILENRDNPKGRMGNIPMPIGYFVPMIPVPVMHFPQFMLPQAISLMPPPPSIDTGSRSILPASPSDMDEVTQIPTREDFGISSTSQPNGQSDYQALSGICSTGVQDTEISSEETCPSIDLQSNDERITANIMLNTKSTEDHTIVQEQSSFPLPTVRVGSVSYPVALVDPVWRLPNPAFCITGTPDFSLKLCNPFYASGPFHTIQTMMKFEKESHQPDSGLNSDSDDLSQAESVSFLQTDEQPLHPTKITEKAIFEIHDERAEIETSLSNATGSEFTVFSSLGNFNGTTFIEQGKQPGFNSLRSNEILENCLEETLDAVSSPEIQGLSQPACAVSISASEKNDCPQVCSGDCSDPKSISIKVKWQKTNFLNPHQIPSSTQNIPEYFGALSIESKLQEMLNNRSAQSSEENEYPNVGNFSFFSNDKRNEKIDSIPLYIDTCTTQKMEKLLKPAKYTSNC